LKQTLAMARTRKRPRRVLLMDFDWIDVNIATGTLAPFFSDGFSFFQTCDQSLGLEDENSK
jgi:hypothetical protein